MTKINVLVGLLAKFNYRVVKLTCIHRRQNTAFFVFILFNCGVVKLTYIHRRQNTVFLVFILFNCRVVKLTYIHRRQNTVFLVLIFDVEHRILRRYWLLWLIACDFNRIYIVVLELGRYFASFVVVALWDLIFENCWISFLNTSMAIFNIILLSYDVQHSLPF